MVLIPRKKNFCNFTPNELFYAYAFANQSIELSKNCTFLNGYRLGRGEVLSLKDEDEIIFGRKGGVRMTLLNKDVISSRGLPDQVSH